MSTMFFFGAGASAFSGECRPSAPPLGAHLFRELASLEGIAASVTGDLRRKFEENFETGMAEFLVKHQADTPALIRQMAIYFAQFSPMEKNLYRLLIRTVGKTSSHLVMASLNYDLLLEQAACLEGYSLCYNTPPPMGSRIFEIVKPHGSCNYLPDGPLKCENITFLTPPGSMMGYVAGRIRPAQVSEVNEFCATNNVLAPAMSIYAAGKRLLHSGPFMEEQKRRFENSIASASRLIVLGVAMNPLDVHIWEPIARTTAKVYLVDPAPERHLEWAKAKGIHRRVFLLANDFRSAIPKVKALLHL